MTALAYGMIEIANEHKDTSFGIQVAKLAIFIILYELVGDRVNDIQRDKKKHPSLYAGCFDLIDLTVYERWVIAPLPYKWIHASRHLAREDEGITL